MEWEKNTLRNNVVYNPYKEERVDMINCREQRGLASKLLYFCQGRTYNNQSLRVRSALTCSVVKKFIDERISFIVYTVV